MDAYFDHFWLVTYSICMLEVYFILVYVFLGIDDLRMFDDYSSFLEGECLCKRKVGEMEPLS